MAVGLILAAAGGGSRLGGIPKQIRPLAGRPVLSWSLGCFRGYIDYAVVVTSPALHQLVTELITLDAPPHGWSVVTGGSSRLHSVWAGLQALPADCDRILVHDAARPLLHGKHIRACIDALDQHPAAVLATPCHATAKRCHAGTTSISATVDRSDLWLAQTPQAFRREVGMDAFARLIQEDEATIAAMTDDIAVCEWAGYSAQVVPGEISNLKITSQDDWDLAEAIFAWRNDLG